MTQHSNAPTLTVQGQTPYAQVPRWILRSGDSLSHGAVRLYGVIMTYADNSTRAAFPGRETLAEDMGASVASVKRYIKELEESGALIVTRRRSERTGNFYANHYVLVFDSPWVTDDPRPGVAGDPITRPTVELDSLSSTSDQRSNAPLARARSASAPMTDGPGDLPMATRAHLRRQIQKIGVQVRSGHNFQSEHITELWEDFKCDLEEYAGHIPGIYELTNDMDNGKWTIGKAEADPYRAGAKLNKMIHSAGCL